MAPVRAAPAPLTLARTTLAGLRLPGHVLRRAAAPLDFAAVDQAQRRAIVRGLLGALHAPPGGVGLAAPMAGLDLRLVIATDAGRVLTMVNPELLATGGGEVAYQEGNLCLPGLHAEVVRPATLTVRWQDGSARTHEETFDGWLARILFHELELLDGGFFTDHVAAPQLHGRTDASAPLNVLTLPPDLLDLRCTVLRQPAAAVAQSGITRKALRGLVAALLLTLRARGGGGLAAPQLGVGLRVAVVDDRVDAPGERPGDEPGEPLGDSPGEPLVLIDAEIVDRSDATETSVERCLSVPGSDAPVARPTRIRVRNHTLAGESYDLDAEGPLARLIAHELDHLDGILHPDRASGR